MAILYFDNYKQNRTKTGISSRQRVTIQCDLCDKEWQTQYSNYKSKTTAKDLCQSCRNKSGICGMKNKRHTLNTRKDMSESRKGKENSFYGKSHSDKTKKHIRQTLQGVNCRKTPISEKERKATTKRVKAFWRNMSKDEKKEQLRGLANWRSNGRLSKIHQKVKLSMREKGIFGFLSEEHINGLWIDEYNPDLKIAIEVNGDYWHANPRMYNKNYYNKKIKMTASQIWEKDDNRISALEDLNIKVFVIWEYQTKDENLLDYSLKEIKTWIDRHT